MRVIKLIIAFLISSCAFAQTDVNCDKIEKSEGVVVVEFWASWNQTNCLKFMEKVTDCVNYRVDVEKLDTCMTQYEVTSLPTLILFDAGDEIFRWEADISFKLDVDREAIQEKVDELLLDKF